MIRILLADDHPTVRSGLSELLSAYADFLVVGAAADGEAAIQLTNDEQPDVILMDIQMPGMGGIEATRQITTTRPDVRVIMLSAFSEPGLMGDARAAGAADFLAKGIEPAELVARIREAAAAS